MESRQLKVVLLRRKKVLLSQKQEPVVNLDLHLKGNLWPPQKVSMVAFTSAFLASFLYYLVQGIRMCHAKIWLWHMDCLSY